MKSLEKKFKETILVVIPKLVKEPAKREQLNTIESSKKPKENKKFVIVIEVRSKVQAEDK